MGAKQRNASDRGSGSPKVEQGPQRRRPVVYQLSCRQCTEHRVYVGATTLDLKTTAERHIDRVVEVARNKPRKNKGSAISAGEEVEEKWSDDFARHFAGHCRPRNILARTMPEKEIVDFCRANVKVELLKSKRGVDMSWEEGEELTDVHRSWLARRGRMRKEGGRR